MRKHWRLWLSFVILIAVLLLYPFETMVVPAWRIRVVDMVGAPVGGFPVSQHWQHHSVERRGHQQVLVTDNDGYVNFPRRTVRGSLMLRVLKPIFNILTQGVHVDLGIYAYIVPHMTREYQSLSVGFSYSPNEPLSNEILVRRRNYSQSLIHDAPLGKTQ